MDEALVYLREAKTKDCDVSDENLIEHGYYMVGKESVHGKYKKSAAEGLIWTKLVDGELPGMVTLYLRMPGVGLALIGSVEEKWVEWQFADRYLPYPSNKNFGKLTNALESMVGMTVTKKLTRKQASYRFRAAFREAQSVPRLVAMCVFVMMFLSQPVGASSDVSAPYFFQESCNDVTLFSALRSNFTHNVRCSGSYFYYEQTQLTMMPAWQYNVLLLCVIGLSLLSMFLCNKIGHYALLFNKVVERTELTNFKDLEYFIKDGTLFFRTKKYTTDFTRQDLEEVIEVPIKIPRLCEAIIPTSAVTDVDKVSNNLVELCYSDCKTDTPQLRHIGWGVSIAQGVGLTCAHVLDDFNALGSDSLLYCRLHVRDGKGFKERVVAVSEGERHSSLDLATITLPWGLTTARLSNLSIGDSVCMIGAGSVDPTSDGAWSQLKKVSPGNVTGIANGMCEHSVSINYGNSGQPIWRGNAIGAIHSGRMYSGVTNKAIIVDNALIQWIRDVAAKARTGTTVGALTEESMNIDDFMDFHGLTWDKIKRDPYDPSMYFCDVDGRFVSIDATDPKNIYTEQERQDGTFKSFHPREVGDWGKRGEKTRKWSNIMDQRHRRAQAGLKVVASRKGKQGARTQRVIVNAIAAHNARKQGKKKTESSTQCDPEFVDEDGTCDTPASYIKDAMVVGSCSTRHITPVDDIDEKLNPADFGVDSKEVEKWALPILTKEMEYCCAQQVQKLGGSCEEIPEYKLKKFNTYLDLIFTHRIPKPPQRLTYDEAMALVIQETGDKTPGFKFMLDPVCKKPHNMKSQVRDCSECSKWLKEQVENVNSGKVQQEEEGYCPIFNMFMKEEHTTYQKVEEMRQRLIWGGDMVLELVQRMTHTNAYHFTESCGTANPLILGFCLVHGGHQKIASKLEGCELYEADVSSMDLRLSSQLIGIAYDSWCHVMRIDAKHPACVFEREVLAGSKLVRIGDHIELVDEVCRPRLGLNPSGHYLTTIINSFASIYVNFDFSVQLVANGSSPLAYADYSTIFTCASQVVNVIHGDDCVLGIRNEFVQYLNNKDGKHSKMGADKSSFLMDAYSAAGLKAKYVKRLDTPDGMSFLGFIWRKDSDMYRIHPAYSEKLFLRLNRPLREAMMDRMKLSEKLYSLAIISVNNLKFQHGLKQYADSKGVTLPELGIRKSIMDGTESLRGDLPAISIDWDEFGLCFKTQSTSGTSITRKEGTDGKRTGSSPSSGDGRLASPPQSRSAVKKQKQKQRRNQKKGDTESALVSDEPETKAPSKPVETVVATRDKRGEEEGSVCQFWKKWGRCKFRERAGVPKPEKGWCKYQHPKICNQRICQFKECKYLHVDYCWEADCDGQKCGKPHNWFFNPIARRYPVAKAEVNARQEKQEEKDESSTSQKVKEEVSTSRDG